MSQEDNESSFAAGFQSGITPEDQQPNDDPPHPDPDQQPPANEVDWKAAAEQAKAEAEAARLAAQKAEHALSTLRGKYSAEVPVLQKRLEELEAARAAPAKPQDEELPEAIKVFHKEYPTLAEATMAVVRHELSRAVEPALKPVQDKVERVEREMERVEQTADEVARERHFSAIRDAHADYEQQLQSTAFDKWLQEQPSFARPAIERVLAEGTHLEVIELLDNYKGSKKPAPQGGPSKTPEPPVTAVRGRTIPIGTVGEPDKGDFAAGFRMGMQRR